MIKDLTGKRFKRLYVKERFRKNKITYYKCVCDCGKTVIVQHGHLTSGNTKSCGCYIKDIAKNNFTKHNKSNINLYHVLNMMKQRCYNKNNKSYDRYGLRNILVCDEWLDKENGFMNFYNWAINNGYQKGLTIDRIDVNGNYEPSNCRWVTQLEQQRNRTNNKKITYNNQTKTISEWSNILNIDVHTLNKRIFILNWSIEKALTKPVRKFNK